MSQLTLPLMEVPTCRIRAGYDYGALSAKPLQSQKFSSQDPLGMPWYYFTFLVTCHSWSFDTLCILNHPSFRSEWGKSRNFLLVARHFSLSDHIFLFAQDDNDAILLPSESSDKRQTRYCFFIYGGVWHVQNIWTMLQKSGCILVNLTLPYQLVT